MGNINMTSKNSLTTFTSNITLIKMITTTAIIINIVLNINDKLASKLHLSTHFYKVQAFTFCNKTY